jgi:type VI secretion system secreted protein Hcp
MAFDAFLIFETGSGKSVSAKEAPGETQDSVYKKDKAIEINEYSFGGENATTVGSKSGGAGAGKCTFKEFKFEKTIDTATTGLFQTMCQGGHYETVRLEIRKSGSDATSGGAVYLKYTMKMVFVTDIEYHGSEDAIKESVSLACGAIIIQYWPQDASGKLGGVAEAKWSRIVNKPTDAVA